MIRVVRDQLPQVAWRAVYLGGVIYTGTTHAEWVRLPETGLLVVARAHDPAPYVCMLTGNDWTCWDGETWSYVPSPAGPISTGVWAPRPPVPLGCAKRGDPTTADEFHMWDAIAHEWARTYPRETGVRASG